jgi:hypothetical protein
MSLGDNSERDAPAQDQRLKEWEECRTTIGRIDAILVDLRKYGFTLITGLLTAGSFIGYSSGQNGAGVAAFVAVMCLIAALFSVDMYYSVLQSAAVERALNLEGTSVNALARPPIVITGVMSTRSLQVQAKAVILGVYILLLVVATGLAAFSALTITQGNAPHVGWLPARDVPWRLVVVIVSIGAALVTAMLGYWIFVAGRTGMHRQKPGRDWPREEPFVEFTADPARMTRSVRKLDDVARRTRDRAGAYPTLAGKLGAISEQVMSLLKPGVHQEPCPTCGKPRDALSRDTHQEPPPTATPAS